MKKFVNNTNAVMARIGEANSRAIHLLSWITLGFSAKTRVMTSGLILSSSPESAQRILRRSKWIPAFAGMTGADVSPIFTGVMPTKVGIHAQAGHDRELVSLERSVE